MIIAHEDKIKRVKRKFSKMVYKNKKYDQGKPDFSIHWLYYKLYYEACFYCDDTDSKRGLDRIDNTRGYFKDNVHVACRVCNVSRNDIYSDIDFKRFIGPAIKAWKESK